MNKIKQILGYIFYKFMTDKFVFNNEFIGFFILLFLNFSGQIMEENIKIIIANDSHLVYHNNYCK